VVNGIVYLSGVASTPEELNKVVNHAKNLRFAQEVVNYIILSKDQRE
jgi:osmotically-inducible protein OsmY